jgi:hypothetical protein
VWCVAVLCSVSQSLVNTTRQAVDREAVKRVWTEPLHVLSDDSTIILLACSN